MLKYIFAALLILVVWGLWWWLKLPLWIAVVATIVIILILVTIIVWGVLKARRAANKIEKALASQGAKQAANARPDMQADVNAMQGEFNKAVGALKGSKLGKEALFALPWYVIIGPPGVGKSTALRNSGLQFPYLSDRRGGAVKGIGGTRNCDWWMTNQAVIVDTAGRYTTEDTDRDEWLAFLDLLKDTRPKRPINGILLAVSVTDLALASEEEIAIMSQKIRARIDEVTARLEMSVPVYVLFTKCDLLPGFVEMYSEMGKTERAQIWGFTLPVLSGGAASDPIGVFADQFDRLADRNEGRAFRRLGEERRLDARGKIYAFPQHFELLRDNLASFVGQVFTGNVYAETPLLRGCYFTSGTQEGRPIDRLMGSMAQAFGMQANSLLGQQQVEARSYFLGNLFNKVIFADRELAVRSAKHLRKAKILRWGGASAVFATAVGLAVLPVRSMRQNQSVLAELEDAGDKVAEHDADESATVIKLERIEPLYDVEEELRGYETESKPFKLRWGMYQGAELYPETEKTFGQVGREELIIPLMAERTDVLRRFTIRYASESDEPPPDEAAENFDILRMYLLLAGEVGTYRTGLKDSKLGEERIREDNWLIEQIARFWARALLVTDDADKAKMKEIAAAWVRVLREQPDLELVLDDKLVADAQAVLKRSDRTEAWLAELILESGKTEGVRDLGLRDMVTTQFYKNDDVRIRGAFTRAGWEKYGRTYLSRPPGEFVGSEWVLGLSDEEAAARQQLQRLRLRTRYFEQYIQEWNTFVSKIYIDTPDTLVDSLKMFQDLSRGANPPLKALLTNVSYNSILEEEKLEPGEKPWFVSENWPEPVKAELKKGQVGPSGEKLFFENIDVPKHFEHFLSFGVPPTPPPGEPPVAAALEIDAYQEQLQLVRDAMQAAVDDPAELPALGKRLKSSTTVVKGQVGGQHEQWRARFDAILLPPFDAARGVVEGGEAAGLGGSWCSTIYHPWQETIASKYPFNPKGYDLPLSEFSNWFKPDAGPIWEFYKLSLAARIVKNGNVFSIAPGGSSTLTYNARLPPFLTDVGDIGAVSFPPGSDKPKFEFEVQIDGTPGISEITLTVDGAKFTYRGGPQKWERMTWPGEGDPGGKISAKGLGGKSGDVNKEGEWGFWRLLGEATVTGSAGQQVYSIKWDLDDQGIGVLTIRLKPVRPETPLFGVPSRGSKDYLGLFANTEVPRSVVSGHACETTETPAPAPAAPGSP
ncbi:type VI secretion system membrane subunit TssM [Nannocystaceae bacterium ST9]